MTCSQRLLRTAVLFLILLGAASTGCVQVDWRYTDSHPSDVIDNPWIAVLGLDTIRAEELRVRYEFTPHAGQGLAAREGYLRALLVERMLADYARQCQLDTIPRTHELIAELERETVVESLIEIEGRRRAMPTNADLAEHTRRMKNVLSLEALRCQNYEDAQGAYIRVQSGAPFRSFARSSLSPSTMSYVPPHDLNYHDSDLEFEDAVYGLEPDGIAGPLLAGGSWWVVHLLEIKPLTGERLEAATIPPADLRKIIAKRRLPRMQAEFLNEIVVGKDASIDSAGFLWMSDYLRQVLPPPKSPEEEWASTPLVAHTIAEASPERVFGYEGRRGLDLPMVHLNGFPDTVWTRRDVLKKLFVGPRTLVPAEKAVFDKRLINEIYFLAVFDLLYDMGMKRGITNLWHVRGEQNIWRTHVLAQAGLTGLAKEIGHTLRFDQAPDTSSRSSDARVDSTVITWIQHRADSLGIRYNRDALSKLELTDSPVIARKTHFPNRPVEPMPVGYRWAVLWQPEIQQPFKASLPKDASSGPH